jgi:hypothetical protein
VAPAFESEARKYAREIGASNLSIQPLPESQIGRLSPEGLKKAGKEAAQLAIVGLTRERVFQGETADLPETFSFKGKDYDEALEEMEKYFLKEGTSDGFPLKPPTKRAVAKMLEGTDLNPRHLVGVVGNGKGLATVEKIAINAVMAGCLPQYMPVIVAAVEAITDPRYDLYRVQSTTGPAAPFLIVSGPKLIKDLNINDGFATLGPGWQANSTIGRAIRLILINIGYGWPGKTDMKSLGPFAKFTTLMAENEEEYKGAWEPLRIVEGFRKDQATVSVMTVNSLRSISGSSVESYVKEIARAMKGAYNAEARTWGEENLILLNPAAFDVFREAKLSRAEVQRKLHQAGRVSCSQFAQYRGAPIPLKDLPKIAQIPEEIVSKCRESMENSVAVVPRPEDLKIIVAGGRTGGSAYFVDTWGFGKSFFTTKEIKLPPHWDQLLRKYNGWSTPVIK